MVGTKVLDDVVQLQKQRNSAGITSVCSAHDLVIEASILHAVADGSTVLIEATSNQVDQYGGYTGMKPADFRDRVLAIAERCGLPAERVLLGGDHLGTNRWKNSPAEEAMAKAEVLIESYVAAGFEKIHLDCSYPCAGDPTPLTDEIVAERAARLLAVAERTAREAGLEGRQRYVIGTEVPVPGGAHETIDTLEPTSADACRHTLQAHKDAFEKVGLSDVWPRITAVVVQPGVEFDHENVFLYDPSRTKELREVLDDEPNLVFECHSTDYQTADLLAQLVTDHWAVLKVGPWLTFALREALFALASIEAELLGADADLSRLPEVVEEVMVAKPEQWQSYYEGDAEEQRIKRRYSFSDRLRYYWPDEQVHAAEEKLFANLAGREIPLPLLSQFLPAQFTRVQLGEVPNDARAIAMDRVRDVLRLYSAACRSAGR
ncbi:D-tagatose-bisphosphate aldolase, class II, non-catalytic subunit [Parenemella sanctibonifatiensis]|uniref:D-tagatose-bisphosphate aldolase, class II, non-catalytic subunit n=1 Tax=Parenemella sanctibonifatiensis TaxID=2016505 RepID=A0A255EP69_9ACTN|nr:D-tagatose-bisphosphate aldolase, class II, non-catalytic subunit [Parenemella sanctibonifatiensis]OYN91262.1 D-tagatose-bisphosphate aldolase, class II, non-catalytic subunit [Parenemella sanctibonifatiensis]